MSKRRSNKVGASVCVKNLVGNIVRMKKKQAAPLVADGHATYCPKWEWKESRQ